MIQYAGTQVSDAALRIIDANLNRAREALRTLEDHARLAWDDRELAARCKAMRHALVDIVDLIGGKRLLAARDIENDVGRDVRTSREVKRATPSAVVAAAANRHAASATPHMPRSRVWQG